MSFCPTPRKSNAFEFHNDLYDFTRKLRLRYHFRNSDSTDSSLIKLPSSYLPPNNEDMELEHIINNIKKMQMNNTRPKHRNMTPELVEAMKTLKQKTEDGTIIIKSADKGDVTVVMDTDYYYEMCMKELNKQKFYKKLGKVDPSKNVLKDVRNFAKHYEETLTKKEYLCLTKKEYKMANFYTTPKLHKSTHVNKKLEEGLEYVHLTNFEEIIEGRPIVGGPIYYTSGISDMIDKILKPIISHIPHILRDSFDFVDKCNHPVPDGTLLGTADIKSLYTNLSKDLVFSAIEYWVDRYYNLIPILQRFGLQFILDGLEIILNHNYFFFADEFYQQIHGFAMGTKAAVNCANLGVAYLENKWFDILPQFYPPDFVQHILNHYFRFLDDVFYEWLEEFDVDPFQQSCNKMDPNLIFIFTDLSKEQNYLDVSITVSNYELHLDIYRKPTDSFNYLDYGSCHPSHTRDNIALSLAKRITHITTGDPTPRLIELKNNLMRRGHPGVKIDKAFESLPKSLTRDKTKDNIVFTCTHNPAQRFNRNHITDIFKNLNSDSMKNTFKNTKVVIGTRQPKALRNHLIKSKFSKSKITPPKKTSGLFNCRGCKYHRMGYVRACKGFTFGKKNQFQWVYTRYFNCDSKNVIYVLRCKWCWKFYIGETADLKKRIRKHKSDIKHPKNSFCKVLGDHLRKCSPSPAFIIFPMYYVDEQSRRKFIEKRLINQYKPPLNLDGTLT